MVEQVLSGQGWVGNDMYSPYDPGLRPRTAAARPGPRAGEIALEAGRPHRPERLVRDASEFQGVVAVGRGVRPAGTAAGVTVQLRKVERHVLRPQLPQVDIHGGVLGDARVPAAGRTGEPAQLAVQRVRLEGSGSTRSSPRRAPHSSPSKRPRYSMRREKIKYDRGSYVIPGFLQPRRRLQRQTAASSRESLAALGNYSFKSRRLRCVSGGGRTMSRFVAAADWSSGC